jgi:beta-1,4-mannooligosaccharide/beta-1,4-mannosyl-N-acetylglucosamine phosphorylase
MFTLTKMSVLFNKAGCQTGMENSGALLMRHPANPIFSPGMFEDCYAVFNPGQTTFEGKTLLLLPIARNSGKFRGLDADITAHVAISEDGVNFSVSDEPLFQRTPSGAIGQVREQCIDFRITKIGDEYYIIHPGCGPWGTMGILARTRDWKSMENIDIISLPDNRMPCLFPEKIGGVYCRLDRPYRVAPNDFHTDGNIWLSFSPDLKYWGAHRPLLKPGFSHWSSTKIGPTPPIRTDAGWLVVIHGVIEHCAGHRYSIGAMLLDLVDPTKIIGATREALLSPSASYEYQGIVPNVVFPAGAIADLQQDRLRIYYGCADTFIGLCSGSLSGVLDACLRGGSPQHSK